MDAAVSEWLNLIFRWAHVVAGVTWIGLLYFFNWINGSVVASLDAETKKKVIPELMPRTLFWFRWGAAYTWMTGVLLLGIVYYMGGILVDPNVMDISVGAATGIAFAILFFGWPIYDLMWKALATKETMGVAISFVLVLAVSYGLHQIFSARAAFIHLGALFGTLMAGNVWMKIWPAQRKIIKAIAEGNAPEASWGAVAKIRSKHNTSMSVPLIFMMISNHFPGVYGHAMNWILLSAFVAVGWMLVMRAYKIGHGESPKFY